MENATGFVVTHSSLVPRVLESGTYRFHRDGREKRSVFCLRAERSLSGEETLSEGTYDWRHYVSVELRDKCRDVPIVVYDLEKLRLHPNYGPSQYFFNCERKTDAVVALIILKNY
jgi:hypothetical protein